MTEANERLASARERTRSVRVPGRPMGRAEVAEAVCQWLWETTGQRYELDGHYIAKLERGVVRRPRDAYRAGLRHVLNVVTDAELGFEEPAPVCETMMEPVRGSNCLPNGASDVEAELMDAADESAAWLSIAEASNVGDLTVEQLQVDVRRVADVYLKTPTLPLFVRTRALRDRAFTLLNGRQRPPQARELYAAAGWSLTLLAWMSVDLGRPDAAEAHARTAWACADNADHDGLRAWVCATQHTAAFWQDDYTRAADYASEGLRYATGSAALFLASAYALDLSRAGQTAPAREALQTARRFADTDLAVSDDVPGPFRCSPGRAAGLWSDAHLALGQPVEALELSRAAVTAFEQTPAERRNTGSERMVRLEVAKAHLMLGELDGAADALAPVLATPSEHRVRPLMRRIGDVASLATLPQWSTEAITTRMRDGIAEFIRHTAVID